MGLSDRIDGVTVVAVGGVGEEEDVQIPSLLVDAGDHAAAGDEIPQTQADELAHGVVKGSDALEAGHFGHVHIQGNVEGLEDVVEGHTVGQLGAVGGGAVRGDVVDRKSVV